MAAAGGRIWWRWVGKELRKVGDGIAMLRDDAARQSGVGTSSAFSILEAVAFALGLQDLTAVGQPVQGRPGQAFATEHFGPVFER